MFTAIVRKTVRRKLSLGTCNYSNAALHSRISEGVILWYLFSETLAGDSHRALPTSRLGGQQVCIDAAKYVLGVFMAKVQSY